MINLPFLNLEHMHNHMKLICAGINPVVFVDHHLLKGGVNVDLGFHGIYLYICIEREGGMSYSLR